MASDVHLDFAVILTLLTILTGIGWLIDLIWLSPRRKSVIDGSDKPPWLIDFARSFFPVILAVLILRSFVAEPFRIPSGSMIPTLLIGDFILVNKFAYGLRDPVFHQEFLARGKPERGDVAVFRYPSDPSLDYIKRIVALPGDEIAYKDKTIYINGEPYSQQPDGAYAAATTFNGAAYRLSEQINGVSHRIIVDPSRPSEEFVYQVPEGQYFAMGDNRDGSSDSRVWGTVPEENLVGKAFFVWMSWDGSRSRPNWGRIGRSIE